MSDLNDFAVEIEPVLPDRAIQRRGFASGFEVPVGDLDAYAKILIDNHDPRTAVHTNQNWNWSGLAATTGFRKIAKRYDDDNINYVYINPAGQARRADLVGLNADSLGTTGLTGVLDLFRVDGFGGWVLILSTGIARFGLDIYNFTSFTIEFQQAAPNQTPRVWHFDRVSGEVLIIRNNDGTNSIRKYPTLNNAIGRTSESTVTSPVNLATFGKFSRIGNVTYLTSASGDARFLALPLNSGPVNHEIIASGSFVGGVNYRGSLWWKETTGTKRFVNHRGFSIAAPFDWTTHQNFFVCGAYLWDLSDDTLRYTQDGENWTIHSIGLATQDLQVVGRRLFYSSDGATYVHQFTGLL